VANRLDNGRADALHAFAKGRVGSPALSVVKCQFSHLMIGVLLVRGMFMGLVRVVQRLLCVTRCAE
jgi:hypothetical protein